jgi:hypothetical protein
MCWLNKSILYYVLALQKRNVTMRCSIYAPLGIIQFYNYAHSRDKHSTRTHMHSYHVCLLCTCSKRCVLLVCAGLLRIGSLYAQTSNKNCRFFCVHTQFTHMFSVLCACSLSIIMRMLNISLLSLSVCSVLANKSKPIPSRTGEINHL